MDSDLEFTQLVRKSGIVFTTNLGQGPEEVVLAITTPTMQKTQVATQADLVAAGFIKVDALKRLEAERDRLLELLKAADEHRQTMTADKHSRETAMRALEERAQRGEIWKKAEHEGVIARNRGEALETNPYDERDEIAKEGHQAWRHGWRLRDVLLDLSERLKQLQAEHQALQLGHEKLQKEAAELRQALSSAEGASAAREQAAAAMRAQLETTSARNRQLEEALRAIWAEAPHSPACALWTAAAAEGKAPVVACNCWRSRMTGPAAG